MDSTQNPGDEVTEELFAAWIAERGDSFSDREFAALLAAHPERDAALRACRRAWERLADRREELGFAEPGRELGLTSIFASSNSGAADRAQLEAWLLGLRSAGDAARRYRIRGEIGSGGIGVVLDVWDELLGRSLCMKLLRRQWEPEGPELDAQTLGRFLDEAQIAGRLSHPGIVPVHDVGLDAQGRVYYTMERVRGEELGVGFRRYREGEPGHSLARLAGEMLKVCQTVSYAHARGVVHRDLKPANVMVGRFGEVYVLDWGLARILGRAEDPMPESARELASGSGSGVETLAGQAVGTAVYMAPEQARGELERVDERCDVYSIGAMLYELLAGHGPYLDGDAPRDSGALLERVQREAPRRLGALAPAAPPELIAIAEKAMARAPEQRYARVDDLASDLSAFLEGRVVAAYASDPLTRCRKWIARNRTLSAAASGVLLAGLLLTVQYVWRMQSQEQVFRLSAFMDLSELRRRADALWPVRPGASVQLEAWLRDADATLAALPQHMAQLERLRRRARAATPAERELDRSEHPRARELEETRWRVELLERQRSELQDPAEADASHYEQTLQDLDGRIEAEREELALLQREVGEPWRWRFDDRRDAWWHAQLEALVNEIEDFADPQTGVVTGLSTRHGPGVVQRRELARELVPTPARISAWEAARAAIAGEPRYAGVRLTSQVDLVPLGPDPASGLWEFAHLPSGAVPARDGQGRLVLDRESALVLVLLPGGTFTMGAQTEAGAAHFDRDASKMEQPRHAVELAPFFLSKLEMTQAQWQRCTGDNPSYYRAGTALVPDDVGAGHPVESPSWEQSAVVLARLGLVFPTEAQWEYAYRAGTETVWYTGDDVASILSTENFADRSAAAFFVQIEAEHDDGFPVHAPVGSFAPNGFGLHDMAGNVREQCLDLIGLYSAPIREGTGERLDLAGRSRVSRGGSFYAAPENGRAAARYYDKPDSSNLSLGLRPARGVEEG